MQPRLMPEIQKIVVIDSEAKQLADIKSFQAIGIPRVASRTRQTLYVIRLKNAPIDQQLYLAPEWPTEYRELVSQRKAYSFIPLKNRNNRHLLECEAGTYLLPEEDDIDTAIFASQFKEWGDELAQHCKEKLQQYSPTPARTEVSFNHTLTHTPSDRRSVSSYSSLSSLSSAFTSSTHPHGDPPRGWVLDHQDRDSALASDEDLLPRDSLEGTRSDPLFTREEEKKISRFFGKDLVYSVKKLADIFDKESAPIPTNWSLSPQEPHGKKELTTLVDELKQWTPKQRLLSSDEAIGLRKIVKAANELNAVLKLNSQWEQFKKWMYRALGAIALATPAAYVGFKAGAALGGLVGGGIFSVPSAMIGGVSGAVLGGCAGLWGGYKGGNLTSNFFSPQRAKADHNETIQASLWRTKYSIK